jgi:hypothetical protein
VDTGGNAYVTGRTRSADFPTTPGAVQRIFGGNTVGRALERIRALADNQVGTWLLKTMTN